MYEYISWLVVEPGWQTWRLLYSCGAPSVSYPGAFQPPVHYHEKDDDADADFADFADEDKEDYGDSDPIL